MIAGKGDGLASDQSDQRKNSCGTFGGRCGQLYVDDCVHDASFVPVYSGSSLPEGYDASAPRWPRVSLKILLPMRIESIYTRMHIVYTSALLLCVVSLLATSLSSLYAFRRRVACASLARLCFISS